MNRNTYPQHKEIQSIFNMRQIMPVMDVDYTHTLILKIRNNIFIHKENHIFAIDCNESFFISPIVSLA